VKKFIKNTSSNILFICGEFDPWSASGFEVIPKSNLLKIVKPGGFHSSADWQSFGRTKETSG
jgi:hypothetical protein